ncbi:hypothetical protein [Streptomyces narbonensis]
MKALPEVESVGAAFPSPDGKALLLPVTMTGDTETADTRVQPLLARERDDREGPRGGTYQVAPTTAQGLGETLGEEVREGRADQPSADLVVLLVVFGAVIAAGASCSRCPASAPRLAFCLASQVPAPRPGPRPATSSCSRAWPSASTTRSSTSSGSGNRKGASHLDVIEIAAETSGHTVVVSGTTVIVSMAGLLAQEATFASLATGSIIVVAVAVLAR